MNLPVFLPFEIQCSLHISVQEVQNCQQLKHDTFAWEEKTHLLALHGALVQKGQKAKQTRQNAEGTFLLERRATEQSLFFFLFFF